ncbi:pyrroline-5-carboxylate reductase [Endozoicomonas montiporae]|uniref:Pyrroline-5-carboxylate reductase n=2 Tax=Endozoicomonas montiporae TaxID=1027273 RepID=A0A081MZG7_9GAMM|nr:pyrroline-5-carboxylate reductase [Endozoicomonas montiporae]AMO54727.1 pyrroline-5-carboxylate reductase [Endozoicomonas montiporae CL-33]KEQ11590.1 pyrroline-5-carboxylate reductase [Endozoicomonas montiporae]
MSEPITASQQSIAFIGAGNMASSIIGGLIDNGWAKDSITATARSEETRNSVSHRFGIQVTDDNHQAVEQSDIVVLCVKPQVMKTVLLDLAPTLQETKPLLISVAAGIDLASLQKWGGSGLPIVRSMPNTPSLLRSGASGLFANELVNESQRSITDTIFKAVGIVLWVQDEARIDTVIAISGSGPAYYFLFMEAMTEMGVKLGLDQETAKQLTLQTALGAAKMAVYSDVDAKELRRRVTSPGGTTEQAIKTFQAGGLEQLVEQAMKAASDRAAEMTRQLAD